MVQLAGVRIWPKADKDGGYKEVSYKVLQNLIRANRRDWKASWRRRYLSWTLKEERRGERHSRPRVCAKVWKRESAWLLQTKLRSGFTECLLP